MDSENVLDYNIDGNDHRTEVATINSGKFIFLFLMTFGLYALWWMYHVWDFYKKKEQLDIMPAMRSILVIIFMIPLFDKIKNDAQSKGYSKSYSSILLYLIYVGLSILMQLPTLLGFIGFLSFVVFLQPLVAFNYTIAHSKIYRHRINDGYSTGEIACILFFGVIWVLFLIGSFL